MSVACHGHIKISEFPKIYVVSRPTSLDDWLESALSLSLRMILQNVELLIRMLLMQVSCKKLISTTCSDALWEEVPTPSSFYAPPSSKSNGLLDLTYT